MHENIIILVFKLIGNMTTRFIKWGKQYTTVMIIPHSEKRPVNFRITHFALMYFFIILISGILFSSIILFSQSVKKEKLISLKGKEKIWKSNRKMMKSEIENLNIIMNAMKPHMQKLYSLVGTKKVDIWAVGGISDEIEKESPKEMKDTQDEVIDLKQLKVDMEIAKDCLLKIDEFLSARDKILKMVPSIWPCSAGGYLTSDYGWRRDPFRKNKKEFHKGLDIACWPGAPIVSTADGLVAFAGYYKGYGFTIRIQHDFGYSTYYGHCSSLKVRSGQKVKKGQLIAHVGKTGRTTGYHLHYEVRIGNKATNPWPYVINYK